MGGKLKPATSRRAKFIALLSFGLVWNGVVWVVVYAMAQEWRRGGGVPWFPVLFLLPFTAVGIGLLLGAAYHGLALFNPRAELTLAPDEVPVGGTARLTWTVSGDVNRLRNFAIVLEGREEATYRRGTDTATDTEVFATIPIVSLTDRGQVQHGWRMLTVPPDAMHSFAAPNNKIVWVLRVRGEVARWPDLDEELPLHVAAKRLAPVE